MGNTITYSYGKESILQLWVWRTEETSLEFIHDDLWKTKNEVSLNSSLRNAHLVVYVYASTVYAYASTQNLNTVLSIRNF